ncbi:MDR family MFS transporter [Priestia koreensis]|uniref:MDR family MFS transporter n=1 Tax=Priestia koreensis TaxID=284581 RepID=UPI0020415673|nr:MFS transporter [Priestia koreensis]MCM3004313.1 MFS transporter [Priestia koreensis]
MKTLQNIHPLGWNIIIGTIFGRMATSMNIPFLAIYLTKVMHVTPSMTGMIIAVSSLVGIFASFYGGYMSDRFGRKTILLLSVFMWTAVFIGFGFSQQVWAFFIMNALNGLCRALFEPTSRAILSDITTKENKLFIFNLRYAAINVGVVFGPLIGALLGASESTSLFFIAAAVYAVYGVTLAITFMRHPISKEGTEQTTRISMSEAFTVTRRDKLFLLTLAGVTLCSFGYSHFSATLSQFYSLSPDFGDGAKIFSIMLSLNAVVVLIIQYPVVRFAKNYSPFLSLMGGNILVSLSLFGFSFAHHLSMIIVLVVFFTIGEVLLFTMMDVLIDEIAKTELKGTYFGAMGFTQFGNVMGPWAGGFLLDYFGVTHPAAIFGTLSFVTIIGIPILFLAYKKLRSKKQKMSAPVSTKVVL